MTVVTRALFGIDAVVALVVVYFFLVGLADGSVSSFNAELWLAMFAVLAIVIGGGWALLLNKHRAAAAVLLAIVAVPGLLYAFFILLVVVFQPRWN
jgi:hypothetical protein